MGADPVIQLRKKECNYLCRFHSPSRFTGNTAFLKDNSIIGIFGLREVKTMKK